MQSSKNKVFNASDIERYHAGTLPVEEMHALEKAALDDPFLADALEGYSFTSTPALDLQKIRDRLGSKESERPKIIPLYKRIDWLKVAAVFILLVGGGILTYQLTGGSDNSIAIQKEKPPAVPKQTPALSPFLADSVENSIVKTGVPAIQNETGPASFKTKETFIKEDKDQDVRTDEYANENAKTQVAEINTNVMNVKPAPVEIQQTAAIRRNSNVEVDESMNRMNRAMPNLNDGYQRGLAKKVDNRANAERKFVEAYNNSRQVDSLADLTIVMQPDSTPPAQVIILGKAEGIAQRKPVVIVDTLEPAEGWAIFDDYIANNLKAPEELKLKSMTGGEVQLSFEVDRNGEPINIAVVKSLCQECDAEAIRLLKEGPRWKRNTRKGKITIRF